LLASQDGIALVGSGKRSEGISLMSFHIIIIIIIQKTIAVLR
jgi:hypothetical protein